MFFCFFSVALAPRTPQKLTRIHFNVDWKNNDRIFVGQNEVRHEYEEVEATSVKILNIQAGNSSSHHYE